MLKAYERFGFGGDFVKWVSVLMRHAKCCGFSDFLWLNLEFNKMSFFSPRAFVLSVELLILVFRENCISL